MIQKVKAYLFSDTPFHTRIFFIVAASALIMALTDLPLWLAAIVSVSLMCCYVVFGGAWGAEMGGIVKVSLLLATSAVCIVVVMATTGGPEVMGGTLQLHMSDSV